MIKAHVRQAQHWNFVAKFRCIITAYNDGKFICDELVELKPDTDGLTAFSLTVASSAYIQILQDEFQLADNDLHVEIFKREQPSDKIENGTVVFHPHLLKFGTVERIVEDRAFVGWETEQAENKRKRKDAYRLDILIPSPVKQRESPYESNSRIVVAGSGIISLIGRCGTVKSMGPEYCTVLLDGENKVRSNFPLRFLHSIGVIHKDTVKEYGVLRGFKLGKHSARLIERGRLSDGFGVGLIKAYNRHNAAKCIKSEGAENSNCSSQPQKSLGSKKVASIMTGETSGDCLSEQDNGDVKGPTRRNEDPVQPNLQSWRLRESFEYSYTDFYMEEFMKPEPDGGGGRVYLQGSSEARVKSLERDIDGREWLRDNEVDIYAHYVDYILKQQMRNSPARFFLADCCFYQGVFSSASRKRRFQGLWRHIPESAEFIFFLVINGNHFSLLLVGWPRDPVRVFALHLDSLSECIDESGEHLEILRNFLRHGDADISLPETLEIKSCKVPRQRDSSNCGPFALLFFQRLAWQMSHGCFNIEDEVIQETNSWMTEDHLYHSYALQLRTDIVSLLKTNA